MVSVQLTKTALHTRCWTLPVAALLLAVSPLSENKQLPLGFCKQARARSLWRKTLLFSPQLVTKKKKTLRTRRCRDGNHSVMRWHLRAPSLPRWQLWGASGRWTEVTLSLSLRGAERHLLSFCFCHFWGLWSTLKRCFCCLLSPREAVKYHASQVTSSQAWP